MLGHLFNGRYLLIGYILFKTGVSIKYGLLDYKRISLVAYVLNNGQTQPCAIPVFM